MIGCRQVGGGSLRGLGAQAMGFHCAKLQIVPWNIGLDRAASYSARVPLIGSCVKRRSLLPVGLFFAQNKHIWPRDLIFTGFVGSFVPCPSVNSLLPSREERWVISEIRTQTKNIPSPLLL